MPETELKAKITGDSTGLVAAAKKAQRGLKSMSDVGTKAGKSISAALGGISAVAGKIVKVASLVGGALATAGVLAVRSWAKFEAKFAQVRTLVDESTVDIKKLALDVRDLSVAFGTELLEATDAAYQAISAGVKPAEAVAFLGEAFKAAVAGAAATGEAVDALTTVLNSFGKRAGGVTRVSDILFSTIKAGKTTMSELAGSIGQVAPIAANAGVRLTEMGGALATLTAGGLSTAEATTGLKAIIAGIIKPSKDAAEALDLIGVSAANLKREGLAEQLQKVRAAVLAGNGAVVDFFPNIRALGAAANLTGLGFESLGKNIKSAEESSGAAAEAFKKVEETLSFQFGKIKQTILDTFLSVGQALGPLAKAMAGPILEFVSDTRTEMLSLVSIIQAEFAKADTSISKTADGFEANGGLITAVLDEIGDRTMGLGVIIADFAKPLAGAFTGVKLAFDLVSTGIKATVGIVAAGVGQLIQIIGELIGAAASAARKLGADGLAGTLDEAGETARAFGRNVEIMGDKVERSALKSAASVKAFDETYVDLVGSFEAAGKATTAAGESAIELARRIRDEGAAAVEAAKAEEGHADALALTEERLNAEAMAAKKAEVTIARAGKAAATAMKEMASAGKKLDVSLELLVAGFFDAEAQMEALRSGTDATKEQLAFYRQEMVEGNVTAAEFAEILDNLTSEFEKSKAAQTEAAEATRLLMLATERLGEESGKLISAFPQAGAAVDSLVARFNAGRLSADQFREALIALESAALSAARNAAFREQGAVTTGGGASAFGFGRRQRASDSLTTPEGQAAAAQLMLPPSKGGRGLGPKAANAAARQQGFFDLGGDVMRSGMSRLQKGEFVVSRETSPLVAPLLKALEGLRGGNSNTFNQTFNVNAPGGEDLDEQAQRILPHLREASELGLGQGGMF